MARPTSLAFAALLGIIAACGPAPGGTAAPSATGAPSAASTATISHAAGSADLLLRISVGGGFAGLETTPRLSLYGDGSLIYLIAREPFPSPVATVRQLQPFRVGRLAEDEVQAILRAAVSAIGPARASYQARGADYFTYTFTLRAGGLDKSVSAFGLEAGDPAASDAPTWAALRALVGLVSAVAAAIQSPPLYAPEAYLGRLSLHVPEAAGIPWPWPFLRLGDFTPLGANAARERRLSAADVALLGIPNIEGGFDGLVVIGPDGRPYDLRLRPLLPDQAG